MPFQERYGAVLSTMADGMGDLSFASPEWVEAAREALGAEAEKLHDELSKRTSGELPADFDPTIKSKWAAPQGFDRNDTYDPSWVRYDEVDIYGVALI